MDERRENDPFCGTFSPFAKSLIQLKPDCRKNLVQKESMNIGYARVFTEEPCAELRQIMRYLPAAKEKIDIW